MNDTIQPEPERWLDQFLGERSPLDPTRDDVLSALRGHVLGTVVLEYERDDGSTALHLQGALAEASRDPETWETAERFVLLRNADAQRWHLHHDLLETIPGGLDPIEPVGHLPEVPGDGIEEYLGGEAGCSGYRWPAGPGLTAAVVIWHDALSVTPSGDLAPGFGFEARAEDAEDGEGRS
jgi:hypothetical protein